MFMGLVKSYLKINVKAIRCKTETLRQLADLSLEPRKS